MLIYFRDRTKKGKLNPVVNKTHQNNANIKICTGLVMTWNFSTW